DRLRSFRPVPCPISADARSPPPQEPGCDAGSRRSGAPSRRKWAPRSFQDDADTHDRVPRNELDVLEAILDLAPETIDLDGDRSLAGRVAAAGDVMERHDAHHPPIVLPIGLDAIVAVIAVDEDGIIGAGSHRHLTNACRPAIPEDGTHFVAALAQIGDRL